MLYSLKAADITHLFWMRAGHWWRFSPTWLRRAEAPRLRASSLTPHGSSPGGHPSHCHLPHQTQQQLFRRIESMLFNQRSYMHICYNSLLVPKKDIIFCQQKCTKVSKDTLQENSVIIFPTISISTIYLKLFIVVNSSLWWKDSYGKYIFGLNNLSISMVIYLIIDKAHK